MVSIYMFIFILVWWHDLFLPNVPNQSLGRHKTKGLLQWPRFRKIDKDQRDMRLRFCESQWLSTAAGVTGQGVTGVRGASAPGLCLPGSPSTSPFLVFPLSLSTLLFRHHFLSSHSLSCHARILRITFYFQHPNPSTFHASKLPS